MADRDLTPAAATHADPYGPAEARAEVEAFMGEGFACLSFEGLDGYDAVAHFGGNLTVRGTGPTYRAAVDVLKAAWRDAVRPWMEAAIEAKLDTADVDGYAPDEVVIARVLKEDSK